MSVIERFSAAALVDFTRAVLVRLGVPEDGARLGAEILVDADLMGVDSHGIAHLSTPRGYAYRLKAGEINPTPNIRVVRETAATALVDGDGGFGLLVGYRAMQVAIAKAREAGSGSVAVTNSRHFGSAGYFARMALAEEMIGIALTNASPWAVPTFGRRPMIGTNPIAVAAPAGTEQPFFMDMATTTVAMGKLEIAEREEKPIPPGWALDETGATTTDISRTRRGGGLTPLGASPSTSSYKGYALGQLVDVLCGVLSGAGFSMILPRATREAGHFFQALRIDAFRDPADFKGMMDEMQRIFRNAETIEGAERVLLPGQREFEARAERERDGIPLHDSVVRSLDALGAELGVPPPRPWDASPAAPRRG